MNMTERNKIYIKSDPWTVKSKTLKNILMFIIFLTLTNNDFASLSYILYWGMLAGGSILLILLACYRGQKVYLNNFLIWLFIFLAICSISYVYSVDKAASLDVLKGLIVNVVVLVGVMWNIRSMEDINTTIKVILWVIVVNSAYLLVTVDWSLVGTDRLGTDYTGRGWNANTIGMMSVWGMLFVAYVANLSGNKKYYLVILLFLPLLIYSGSRKAWVSTAAIAMAIIFINNKKHLFLAALITVIATAALYYLVINVEFLYNIGGHRLEALINGVFYGGEMDSSAEKRLGFVEYGIRWFKEKPLLGYGVHAYARLLGQSDYGLYTYSHNNYIELLVGVGLVGTITYYAIYVYVLVLLIKQFFWERKYESKRYANTVLFLTLVAISLVMQYGMVMYTNALYVSYIMLPYLYVKMSRSKLSAAEK